MAWVLPQVALQRVIQIGLKDLKGDEAAFNRIFAFYKAPEMEADYGQAYIDTIRKWFDETVIPVNQAWSFNMTVIPQLTIHLAQEQEEESKASLGDFFGKDADNDDLGVAVFSVTLDIGIHGARNGDSVLWLYYALSYILFKNKLLAEDLGLRLQTFSASDYSKEAKYMADNIWSRWIRFKCITQNHWEAEKAIGPFDVDTTLCFESANEDEP